MEFIINIKPVSINQGWKRRGRIYKSEEYKNFEKEFLFLAPKPDKKIKGSFGMKVNFYLRRFGQTDIDNLLKPLLDCCEKKGYFENDRYLVHLEVNKFKSKEDAVEISLFKV